eukprot:scaffold78889_cov44-Attheya_sp.AAC.1
MEPHPAREWIQMTPMDIITDDGSYGTTPSQGMDPDDTPMDIDTVEFYFIALLLYCTCLIQITDDGSYGITPSQGMDPHDTNGHL